MPANPPPASLLVQRSFGPPSGHLARRPFSALTPDAAGPRHWGQSAPSSGASVATDRPVTRTNFRAVRIDLPSLGVWGMGIDARGRRVFYGATASGRQIPSPPIAMGGLALTSHS